MPQPPRPPDKTLDAEKDAALDSLEAEIARQNQEISALKEKLYGSKPSRHNEKQIVRRLRDLEYETGPSNRWLRRDAANEIVIYRVWLIIALLGMWAPILAMWLGYDLYICK
jgi:hypothetical protein